MKKFGGFIKQKITDFDLYPKTINFTLWGKDQFQTFFGGTVSLVIRILIQLEGNYIIEYFFNTFIKKLVHFINYNSYWILLIIKC